jgi:hypothetical protein
MSLASKPFLSVEPSPTGDETPGDGFSRELMAAYENWDFSSLPISVVERIKLFVLDTLGVIAAATDAPGIPEMNRLLLGWEGAGPSTMLIGKGRVAPPTAALANGAAAHALDFDDNHDPGRVHAYAVILPAALAAAEANSSPRWQPEWSCRRDWGSRHPTACREAGTRRPSWARWAPRPRPRGCWACAAGNSRTQSPLPFIRLQARAKR